MAMAAALLWRTTAPRPCSRVSKRSRFQTRRSTMSGLLPSIGRRHFLTSAAVGVVGACLPLSSAHAATTPPPSPGPEVLTQAPIPAPSVTILDSAVIGAAATEHSGDTSIRPFIY